MLYLCTFSCWWFDVETRTQIGLYQLYPRQNEQYGEIDRYMKEEEEIRHTLDLLLLLGERVDFESDVFHSLLILLLFVLNSRLSVGQTDSKDRLTCWRKDCSL